MGSLSQEKVRSCACTAFAARKCSRKATATEATQSSPGHHHAQTKHHLCDGRGAAQVAARIGLDQLEESKQGSGAHKHGFLLREVINYSYQNKDL